MPHMVIVLLKFWRGHLSKHSSYEIQLSITLCIMWCLWKRNASTSEGCELLVIS